MLADSLSPIVHSVFGELVLGLDILDTISNVKVGPRNKPVEDIIIDELNIIRKGKDAKKFDAPNIFINHFAEVERLEKEKAAKAEAVITASKEKFNKQQEKAITLPSGLQYTITEKGDGEKLNETDQVSTHYTVYFEDGKFLETSKLESAEALNAVNTNKKAAGAYKPLITGIGPNAPMISGFKEGLQQLSVGDKATLFIPYHLGFGEAGGNSIPPKSDIIFKVTPELAKYADVSALKDYYTTLSKQFGFTISIPVDIYVEFAEKQQMNQRKEEAINTLQSFVNDYSDYSYAHMRLAQGYAKAKKYEKSYKSFVQALSLAKQQKREANIIDALQDMVNQAQSKLE